MEWNQAIMIISQTEFKYKHAVLRETLFGETIKFQIILVRLFFKRISRKVFLINGLPSSTPG